MLSPEKEILIELPKKKDAGLLKIDVGDRTIEVPIKTEYTIADIVSVTGVKDQTVHNKLRWATKKDPTISSVKRLIEIPGLRGKRAKSFFPKDSFVKAVIAVASYQPRKVNKDYHTNNDLVLRDGTKVGGLTTVEKAVLQLFVDQGEGKKTIPISTQQVVEAYIAASGNPQISKQSKSQMIRELSEKLAEQTDFTITKTRVYRYTGNGREVEVVYLLRKRVPEELKNDSSIEEKTRGQQEVVGSESRTEIGLKATLEILSFWAEGKPQNISRNVRIILGHHLPRKTTIPAIFGSNVTDEELKNFLIGSFTLNLNKWWYNDPKAIEYASDEEIKIAEKCQQLRRLGNSTKGLIGELGKTLKVNQPLLIGYFGYT